MSESRLAAGPGNSVRTSDFHSLEPAVLCVQIAKAVARWCFLQPNQESVYIDALVRA